MSTIFHSVYSSSEFDPALAKAISSEQISNKVTSLSISSSDTEYPSAKAIYDLLLLKAPISGPAFTGTVTINSENLGLQSTVTSGGTVTLDSSSPTYTIFTGTQSSECILPDATTLRVGRRFMIDNDSTQAVAMKTKGGADLWSIASGCDLYLTCTNIGTVAGVWEKDYSSAKSLSGKSLTVNNKLTLSGTDGTTITFPSTSATVARTDAPNTFTGDQVFSSTGSVTLPVGSLAQRPVAPQVGMFRVNSTSGNVPEYHNGAEWRTLTEEKYIGISYDTSTATMVRLGINSNTAIGTMLPKNSPVLRNIARVLLSDAGDELSEIAWADKTQDIYGYTVDRSGASGQVMVRLNTHDSIYFSSSTVGTVYTIKFAETQLPGFLPWPGFDTYSKMYIGAYEASLSGGKYFSAAGSTIFPNTLVTSEQQDAYCIARGTGWMQENLTISLLFRTLCLVAWGTYDSSKWVGATTIGSALGRVSLSGGSWVNDSYIGRCGLGDVSSGTAYSGTVYGSAVTQGGSSGFLTDASQVLGVENLFGNVWTRVASLVNNGAIYHKLTSPIAGSYSSTTGWLPWLSGEGGISQLPTSTGYGKTPLTGASIGLPASLLGGSSNTGMFDYYYYSNGLVTLLAGGYACSGVDAGAFYWVANSSAADAFVFRGGRLCFMKKR